MFLIPGKKSAASVNTPADRCRSDERGSHSNHGGDRSCEREGKREETDRDQPGRGLETRPSIEAGTCRCLIVAQTIVPAVSSALKRRHATIELPGRSREAVARDRERGERPGRRT